MADIPRPSTTTNVSGDYTREALYQTRRPAPIHLWFTPSSRHLSGRPRHRFVQGQNRQSGPIGHRLSGHCRDRLPLSAPATLLPIPPTLTCARGHIRARFSTRRPLHPGSRSNPVDAWNDAHQLPRPVRHHDGIAFPFFFRVLAKRGNSNTQERIELLGQFLTLVSGDKIDCLVVSTAGRDVPFSAR